MSRKKSKANRERAGRESFVEVCWALLKDNPELASMLAFELGALAGTIVRHSAQSNKYLKSRAKKVPQAIADAVPESLSNALKFLPAPKLQPSKKTRGRRSSPRKAKHAV